MARNNRSVEIRVAVDAFSSGYARHHGWQEAEQSRQTLSGRYAGITALPSGIAGQFTDYRQALRGVAQRFGDAQPSSCNLFLWFTDGEHATEGTSSDVSEQEWEQLRQLCDSAHMAALDAKRVYTLAVLLSSPDAPINAGPLRHLFAEGDSRCRYALAGEIRSDVNAADLNEELDELINEVVYEVTVKDDTDHDLPGEPDVLPGDGDDDEFADVLPGDGDDGRCSGGNGTPDSPCLLSFSLEQGHESFRAFVDMTFLEREIREPENINIRLRSPSGVESAPITADLTESTDAIYQPVRPFWFLARRPYDSRWEIIGHQAAEQLAKDSDWEWVGEWKLEFWGDTPEAADEAAKVAAVIRYIPVDAPVSEMSLNDEGKLIGFIENFPNDYNSVELNLEIHDVLGAALYPTRPELKCESSDCSPLSQSGPPEHRFELANLRNEIIYYDSEPAGGDGLQLRLALGASGPLSAVARLDQEFFYGGTDGYGNDGERGPLEWSRPIGRRTVDGLEEAMSAAERWEDLIDWLNAGAPQALPSDLQLLPPPYSISGARVAFSVAVVPGRFPGMITLQDVRARFGDAGASALEYDRRWSCEVPGTWGRGDTEAFTCPVVRVDLGLSEDSDVTAALDFLVSAPEDLEARARSEHSGMPSAEDWNRLWERVEQADRPSRHTLESDSFRIDLSTASDRVSEFLPILVFLAALASALRVLVAWRLRPWSKLDSAEIVVMTLPDDNGRQTLGSSVHGAMCMDLTRRTAAADLGGTRLVSSWTPLLLGRRPKLVARSSRHGCVGSKGHEIPRTGKPVGIIGPDLEEGWAVELDDAEHRLIIWDVPGDEPERSARLLAAVDEARARVEELQQSGRPETAPRESSRRPASGADHLTSDPFEAPEDSDPFGQHH
ncbi:MAG: hypothetical protein OXF75_14075 [Acidimicrobiaceae bacterium]|nr:hypothetical protein [Acidimicrobiaceae bacterium]